MRYHYDLWAAPDENGISLLDRVLRKRVEAEHKKGGREPKTTMVIVDSKSIQDADTVKEKGYNAGKNIQHKATWVDILGLPHPIMVTTADVTDRNGAVEMVDYYNDVTNNLSLVKKVLVDGGYAGENFANSIKSLIQAEVEVAKHNELHPFAVILKCWVVECSFGWLDKCRRLWKNCERDMQNSFQMVVIAFIRLLLKRC